MTSRISSLVCAAEGDQLKDPVSTVLLSITANFWCRALRWVSQLAFSGTLRALQPVVEPLPSFAALRLSAATNG